MTQPANPSQALARTLVDELVRLGVTDAVLAPGSRSAALAMVLHDDPRITLHVELDERSAGFLAVGYARATGRVMPVVVTSGSAVANLHPAVVEADTGQVPLLLLTADRPPELRHTGANQTIDQHRVFGTATRLAIDLGVPEDRDGSDALWRSTLGRVVATASGRAGLPAGPVHLDLPLREPSVPVSDDGRARADGPVRTAVDGRPNGAPWVQVSTAVRRPDGPVLEHLAARCATAGRGLIVAGALPVSGDRRTLAEAVHRLARRLGWPVIAEPSSGLRTDPDTVIAHAPLLLAHAPFAIAHRPELVLRLGRTGLSREVAGHLDAEVPQVLISGDGAWDDPERSVAELLVADPLATATGLLDHLGDGVDDDRAWQRSWQAADATAAGAIEHVLAEEAGVSEPEAARTVVDALPAGAGLVLASSMPIRDVDRFAAPRDDVEVFANRGASGIDGFVSTALGVALGRPGPTVALTGDLSLLHDHNGLLLRPGGPRPDLAIVVVDNDGGGIFSFLPQARFPASFEAVFATPHGRDLAGLASFHGLGYRAVSNTGASPAGQLRDAVNDAVADGGWQLVHVRTERQANHDLHRRLTAAVATAIDRSAAAGG